MENTNRIEIREKQGIYDAVSEGLKRDILDLGITGVEDIEYIRVYSLTGSQNQDELERIACNLLADRISQEYSVNGSFVRDGEKDIYIREIRFNPGVMDPVEESALKAIRDIGIISVNSVTTADKYVLKGALSEQQIEEITEKLLYNRTTQHVADDSEKKTDIKPYTFRYEEVKITCLTDTELIELSGTMQLYLSLEEMRAIKEHFEDLGREPSDCEIESIAQTWSEHCKHKTMMGAVDFNGTKIDNLLKQTVMRATTELDKDWCVSVFKDNAGIIKFNDDFNICFKVETHNHPSALEPYGGAETGIGGVIRDPMGTGKGAKPILNTDIFCFGYPDMPVKEVPKGALHPKRVLKGVVSGVRDYGNRMGIPTVNGAVCFDERYTGNPLVFCGNVGIMPAGASFKKVSTGEKIVVIGGKTGRDGIHGATFSSAELTHESETISSTAVQIGNPITEKKMVDTLIAARDKGLYEAITDCGAGGLSSAVGEMGEHTGARVDLEKVPLKYEGLKPWEIWVSEAQERMVLSVRPEKLEELLRIFSSEDVEATVIGEFTGDKKLRLYYEGKAVADLEMSFLHDGIPSMIRKARWEDPKPIKPHMPDKKEDHSGDLLNILAAWDVCSKEWIIRQYDHEVQGGSVLKPLTGVADDGPSDASVTRPFPDDDKGIILSNGINPNYGDIDPYWMAASSIDEALRQIVCAGGEVSKTALLDNFCWGNTEDPDQLGALVRASQACYDMAIAYGTPFISGKDSLNNEFNTGKGTVSIPSTLLISAVCVTDDVKKSVSSDLKAPGSNIFIAGETLDEMGGSQYFKYLCIEGGEVPRVDPERSLKIMDRVSKAIKAGLVLSCHDCSDGGIAVAIAEMAFSGGYGAEIELDSLPGAEDIDRDDVRLFSESNSRFVLEIAADKEKEFHKIMQGCAFKKIGRVREEKKLSILGANGNMIVNTDIDRLKKSWQNTFSRMTHE